MLHAWVVENCKANQGRPLPQRNNDPPLIDASREGSKRLLATFRSFQLNQRADITAKSPDRLVIFAKSCRVDSHAELRAQNELPPALPIKPNRAAGSIEQ